MPRRRAIIEGMLATATSFPTLIRVAVAQPAPTQTDGVAVITMGSNTYRYAEADGVDMGSASDPLAPLLGIEPRFAMTCRRVARPDCPIRVDFRHINGWSCAVFELSDWRNTAPRNLPGYSVQIAGRTIAVPAHWANSRWRWQSGKWPLPITPVADLVKRGLLPNYASFSNPPYGPSASVTYTPMGLAGITGYMPETGARPDIGYVTDWTAEYLCTGRASALANLLAQGEAAGTLPWMLRDLKTGAPIDVWTQYPGASLAGGNPKLHIPDNHGRMMLRLTGTPGSTIRLPANNTLEFTHPRPNAQGVDQWIWVNQAVTIPASGTIDVPATLGSGAMVEPKGVLNNPSNLVTGTITAQVVPGSFAGASGIAIDCAHMPSLSYVPLLLTGDPYHLENLQAAATWCFIEQGRGTSFPTANQIRGASWSFRTIAQAARATPARVPSWLLPQSAPMAGLDFALKAMTATMNDGSALRSVFHTIVVYLLASNMGFQGDTYYGQWQDDYFIIVMAAAALMFPNRADIAALLKWCAQNLVDRLGGTSGWCTGVTDSYMMQVRDVDAAGKFGPFYNSWAQAWAATAPKLGIKTCPSLAEYLRDNRAWDYASHCYAASALASQAGVAGISPLRDKLAAALRTAGASMGWNAMIA